MKKVRSYFNSILVFTLMWIVLNEKAGYIQIFTGIIISFIGIFFTDYFLLTGNYVQFYYINPIAFIRYLIYLIYQIYKSGFSAIIKVIKGSYDVTIVDYETCLDDDISICMLANAITLTPGTVTIDKDGNKLKILLFQNQSSFLNEVVKDSCSIFERIIRGMRI